MSAAAACAAWTAAATALLVVADRRGAKRATWLWKPLASAGFVATALASGALGSAYGVTIVVGLALCAVGDVLLIPDGGRALRAGMAFFLLGHLAFFAAFAERGIAPAVLLAAAVAMTIPTRVVVRWLFPHVGEELRLPIVAYASAISVMLAGAAATFAQLPSWTILGGALAFVVSDLSVARDRFIAAAFVNRAWGLPLYYAAQLLLALSARFAAAAAA